MGLICDKNVTKVLKGFGGSVVSSLNEVSVKLIVDGIMKNVRADAVPDYVQKVTLLIGQPWTESADVVVIKDNKTLKFISKHPDINLIESDCKLNGVKVPLWPVRDVTILPEHLVNVEVQALNTDYVGDLYLQASFRGPAGHEH